MHPLIRVHVCSNEPVRYLVGDWTKYVYSMPPDTHQDFLGRTSVPDASTKRKSRSKSHSSVVEVNNVVETLKSLCVESKCECLWEAQARPEVSAKVSHACMPPSCGFHCVLLQMYNMTSFAMTLNEKGEEEIPPTDSTVRPDIRCLENGDIGKM